MTTAVVLSSPRPRLGLAEVASIACSYARARYELRGATLGARVRCHGPLLVRGAPG